MDLLSGPAVVHGAWYYLVLVAVLATPLVRNAVLVVAGGALAARGELLLPLVWAAAFTGGLGGDLLLYAAARRLPLGRRSAAVCTVAARLRGRGLFLLVLRYPAGRPVHRHGGRGRGRYAHRRFHLRRSWPRLLGPRSTRPSATAG
ncbi:hypothetical protein GCM10023086_75520 [Streptomyces venetus]|uniref:DedA family protein n=1 Tax=Streptomyces venetus TaxID=1701086 RepID=A0ABP8HJU0_9ACTN